VRRLRRCRTSRHRWNCKILLHERAASMRQIRLARAKDYRVRPLRRCRTSRHRWNCKTLLHERAASTRQVRLARAKDYRVRRLRRCRTSGQSWSCKVLPVAPIPKLGNRKIKAQRDRLRAQQPQPKLVRPCSRHTGLRSWGRGRMGPQMGRDQRRNGLVPFTLQVRAI